MDVITEQTLKDLLSNNDELSVSIYLDTDPIAVRGDRVDAQRYRRLLEDAAKHVRTKHGNSRQLSRLLDKARNLIDDQDFWKHQSEGLAVFASNSRFAFFRLPISVTDSVMVDSRFYITPLVGLLHNMDFHILAISQGSTHLVKADRYGCKEVELKNLPATLDQALWYKDYDKLLMMRNSAGPAGNYHGEGDDSRTPNSDLREYLLKIDNAVCEYMKRQFGPLVVVALQPTLGMMQKISKSNTTCIGVDHDPAKLSTSQLQQLALPEVEKLLEEFKSAALDDYGTLTGANPDRATADPETILSAATEGRVDTLLVSSPKVEHEVLAFHERIPSTFGADTPDLSVDLEDAVQNTLKNSGRVLFIDADKLGADVTMQAILRY